MKRLGRHVAVAVLGMASMTHAGGPLVAWEHVLSPPPVPIEAPHVPWYDALDASAGARIASDTAISVDLSLRWRLDAPTFLERSAADARDLAVLATAHEYRSWSLDQLERVAATCEDAWRSAQVALIDRVLARRGLSDDIAAEFTLVRALLAPASVLPIDVATISACRLDEAVDSLERADDHPRLVAAAAEQRLGERSAQVADIAAPAAIWLHADAWRTTSSTRAGVRVGIDVPLPISVGSTEMTVSTDGRTADVGVRWAHAAGSMRRVSSVSRSDEVVDLVGELDAALTRLRLEAQLRRLDSTRRWSLACGGATAHALHACLQRTPLDPAGVDLVFAAIDAELLVLHTALAAIDASGQSLERLVGGR